MIRIIIADDHAIVRGGLKQIFSLTSDIVVVSEAAQSCEVLEQWRQIPCELLLLDLTMPGVSGVDLICRLHDEKPDLPILVLSMHNEGQIVARTLKAGAAGYVTKDSEPEILLAAVRKVAAGRPLGEIAERLHLSPKTVSTHKMRLMQKLGIDNNADLVRYATKHGLVSIQ